MKLTGSVVAITGAGRGIGAATARAFALAGARVAVGDLDKQLAVEVATALREATGAETTGSGLDVRDPASFAAFLEHAETQLGELDILVNNAGIMPTGLFIDEDPALTQQMIAVNINGVVTGSRLAAQRFVPRRRGHIVNIASLAGISPEPGVATYCGTKHFVVGFSESLHRELHGSGVGVSTVLPGVIDTELSRGTRVPRWAAPIACADPERVADAVVTAVTADRVRITAPAALGATVTAMSMLPARAKFAITRLLRMDQLVSGADPVARARYHQRLSEQQ